MSFRLVEEKLNNEGNNFKSCKEFFKDIRYHKEVNNSSPLKTDMDNFMLCLILGLKLNKNLNHQGRYYLICYIKWRIMYIFRGISNGKLLIKIFN